MSVHELARSIGSSRLITDPAVMDSYRRDEAHLAEPGHPVAVMLAETAADISEALKWATAHRVPVVTRGAGTGLAGGGTAVEGCLVISTTRMRSILEVNPDDQLAVVEAGVINADISRSADEYGLMYAPDPSSFEISTIGGNIATNAGGLRCVKYGVTRDSVLGLEVVLADGRIVRTGRRTVKGVAGYDLTSLLVGSEGTLGVVTSATLKLQPKPKRAPVTVVGSFDSLRSAADAVAAVVRDGIGPSLLELIDRATLRAVDDWKRIGLEDNTAAMLIAQADGVDADAAAAAMQKHFEQAGADFVAVSQDAAEAAQLLEIRRLAYPASERLGQCLVEDVGVPRSKLPDMLESIDRAAAEHSVKIMTVAHAGDGNVHPTFVFDRTEDGSVPEAVWTAADEVFRHALELGGTLTGEHGVGVLKRRWLSLELGEDSMQLHRSIKAAFDPLGILNPGKGF
ncbi:FAD-binding oxidoreductase [Rhodococcus erythropolis]|jgi:glycolate oxidase|uniref:FAD-binding oxidoreductase n=1 Tax=Rhodococcus TaxID=1827 RepID=UPI000F5A4AD0|nr:MULTISPECIES: FAD-linked oxidase C-terminal domain-containing protein [Rhodococcus]RQO42171.1 FAD-binding oxidoreductase [Rhodococcus sp. KBW08]UJC80604.1 FAD-binding protein [Rhodococcus erythropolis]